MGERQYARRMARADSRLSRQRAAREMRRYREYEIFRRILFQSSPEPNPNRRELDRILFQYAGMDVNSIVQRVFLTGQEAQHVEQNTLEGTAGASAMTKAATGNVETAKAIPTNLSMMVCLGEGPPREIQGLFQVNDVMIAGFTGTDAEDPTRYSYAACEKCWKKLAGPTTCPKCGETVPTTRLQASLQLCDGTARARRHGLPKAASQHGPEPR